MPEADKDKDGHVSRDEPHELGMRGWHAVLLKQLGAVPDLDGCGRPRLLDDLLQDKVDDSIEDGADAVEKGVEVAFAGKHRDVDNDDYDGGQAEHSHHFGKQIAVWIIDMRQRECSPWRVEHAILIHLYNCEKIE